MNDYLICYLSIFIKSYYIIHYWFIILSIDFDYILLYYDYEWLIWYIID